MRLIRAAVAAAGISAIAFTSACSSPSSGEYLAERPANKGTWYTSTPLDTAIRRELPSSGRGENPGMFEELRQAYRNDLIRRNPGLADIEMRRANGEDVPASVPVEFVEMDYKDGFGN
ncbi:hypothetical protein GOV07_04895 [Candidatus Woesearchaeota archaeon]|nr:hypothetical protein [Candidatus Woesearchaeota archaeon]